MEEMRELYMTAWAGVSGLTLGDVRDAEDWFTKPFLPNGGYWEDDGVDYRSCRRCGINMEVRLPRVKNRRNTWNKADGRRWCADCNHPAFLAINNAPVLVAA